MDTSRPDSIYFIGIHYYLKGNLQVAYNYFKKGFEIGYPIGSQYSLKPTLTFHFLPKFLTELSYYFKNYQLGLDSAKLFLTSSKFNGPTGDAWNLMSNWYKIHEQMLKLPVVQVGKTMGTLDRKRYTYKGNGWFRNMDNRNGKMDIKNWKVPRCCIL